MTRFRILFGFLGFLLVLFQFSYKPFAQEMSEYCSVPPFITRTVKPNVLIILDNSNSMDEDFYGNAVGSYSPASKSVVGRKALREMVDMFKERLRIGLMTYRISGVSSYHIHNSPYFVSYEPKSYCPSHNKVCSNNLSQTCDSDDDCSGGNCVDPCVKYCQTGDFSFKSVCENQCQAGNPNFDVDYFDEIITTYSIGSEQRDKYCRLVYPKTQRLVNPSDTSNYVYYKHAYPYYSDQDEGIEFDYSKRYPDEISSSYYAYDPHEGYKWCSGDFCATDYYYRFESKTGTSDGFNGYSNPKDPAEAWFGPTDTDIALGYKDFGRRMMSYHIGRTWFSNSSPGDGYLHVAVDDLVDDNGTNTMTYNAIWSKLDPKEDDEDGYMSCSAPNKNECSYIINAGLTPTAGTLQTAIDYFSGDLTGYSTPVQYWCQKNFIVYVTDGLPSVDEDGNSATADELMPDVLAKIDQLRSLSVNVNGTNYDFDIKTYVLGVGLSDEAKAKLDEMAVHGGTDVDGHAYYADNATQLYEALEEIFTDILKRISSGTAISVLSTAAEGEGSIFQAYFNPFVLDGGREVTWLGYLNALWVDKYGNIREDTDGDACLVLSKDRILHFDIDFATGNTIVQRWKDQDGDGIQDTREDEVPLNEISAIWEGGEVLALTDPDERCIYTFVDFDGDGKPDAGEYGSDLFVVDRASDLRPYLGASDDSEASDIISFIRGNQVSGYRDRQITVGGDLKVWKLGDIVHSTPTVVGRPLGQYHLIYGDRTYLDFVRKYRDRRTVVYVGANDGMLHAFNAGFYHEGDNPDTEQVEQGWYDDNSTDLGKELWAYIPYNLLPHLKWLTDPEYCHVYYVDLKTKVVDARIFTNDDVHPYGWGTVLIGAMRFGGGEVELTDTFTDNTTETRTFRSAYFAMDITQPNNPNLLWEFTDDDLGYTTSYPAIFRLGPRDEKGNWYLIFGSGPNTLDGDTDREAYIYVLDLRTGNLVIKEPVSLIDTVLAGKPSFMASPITIDLQLDYEVDLAYIGVSWKEADGWYGEMIRMETHESENATQWSFSPFIRFDYPITSAPTAALDPFNRLWLFWGTGRYYSDEDKLDTSEQVLFGVWDPLIDSNGDGVTDLIYMSQLDDVTDVYVYEQGHMDTNNDGVADELFNSYLLERRQSYDSGDSYGWYLKLQDGERSLEKPTIVGSMVLFSTFKPTDDICGFGGDSYLFALYYETGTAYKEPVIGTGERTITVQETVYHEVLKKTELGHGMPTSVAIHAGKEEGVVGLVQLGTGVVKEIQVVPATNPKSSVVFWQERK